MNRSQIALSKFSEGYSCAQSVVFSFSDLLDISEDTILKITTGFGAGMGRTQNVCGTVTGAIMVLGMLYGRGINNDIENQEITYDKVQLFLEKFNSEFQTTQCKELLRGCDLLTDKGQEEFERLNLIETCNRCVAFAVTTLEKMISE